MKHLLAQLLSGQPLTTEQSAHAFEQVMNSQASSAQVGALLALIQQRGPTVNELVGAATVMRRLAVHVTPPPGLTIIDTCGTGGDHSQTFNISTAAAIVAAAAGRQSPKKIAVAKHGNRSVTSTSGSSQVLETLGVNIQASPQLLTRCLDEAGLCFCFAPHHHPAMKSAAAVRAELGFRTIFNLLGPLTNPAGAQRQLIGVYAEHLTPLIAATLQNLGAVHAMAVHGRYPVGSPSAGLDELSIFGPTRISLLRNGSIQTYDFNPATLNLPSADPASLKAANPQESAAIIREILAGKPGPARNITCLNAAAALVVGDLAADLEQGFHLAAQAIDSAAAAETLKKLVQITQAEPTS